jgi:hypothetical protein
MERLGLGEAQGIMSIWSKKGIVVHRESEVRNAQAAQG